MAILSCSVTDCDKTGRMNKGMCSMHYQRRRKQERCAANPCSIQACKNPNQGTNTFCRTHQYRLDAHGDPMITGKGKAHKVQYDADGLRICKACGVSKALTEYHADSNGSDGYRAQCKLCRGAYMLGYHETNRDARIQYVQARRINEAEHVRALDRARYERHKDKRIALASDNVRVRRARLSTTTVDAKVTVRNLREIHGDACCYCSVEMDFVRGARGDGIAPNRATLEHVLPLSRGGTHTFSNTRLACHRCNVIKNNKTVAEWEAWKPGVAGMMTA